MNPNLLQKSLCDATSSALTPTTAMLAASNSSLLAVNDLPWIVQPGVSSFDKRKPPTTCRRNHRASQFCRPVFKRKSTKRFPCSSAMVCFPLVKSFTVRFLPDLTCTSRLFRGRQFNINITWRHDIGCPATKCSTTAVVNLMHRSR